LGDFRQFSEEKNGAFSKQPVSQSGNDLIAISLCIVCLLKFAMYT
jgi:hypothetical protein